MAVLMLNNRLPEMVTNQRQGRWEQLFNSAVVGKTLLIVGVGHVGGSVAGWAKRFGMRVIGIRRTGRNHRSVDAMHRPADLPKLLPEADFVLIAAPHTDATHHLIGADEIALLKRGGGLVNYSRANLVDYEALRGRLERGEISAVLDVFSPEPLPSDSPLWQTPNLIITPPFLVRRHRALHAAHARSRHAQHGALPRRQDAVEPGQPEAAVLRNERPSPISERVSLR